jgi:hypothetical protein
MPTTDPLESRLQSMETRLTALEIGQECLHWGVGLTLAVVVGNFAVTIAMATQMLTQKQ